MNAQLVYSTSIVFLNWMTLNRKKFRHKNSIYEVLRALIFTFGILCLHLYKEKNILIKEQSSLVILLRINWFTNGFKKKLLLHTNCLLLILRKPTFPDYQSKSKEMIWPLCVTIASTWKRFVSQDILNLTEKVIKN